MTMENVNQVFIDDSGIIRNVRMGEQTPETIASNLLALEAAASAQRAKGLPVLVLVDLRSLSGDSSPLRMAAARNMKKENYDRVAALGSTSVARIVATLVIVASGQSHRVKFFFDESEALEWLFGGKVKRDNLAKKQK